METILITGGTGLIGKNLTRALVDKNYHVIILTRDKSRHKETSHGASFATWNIREQTIDPETISKADHIIHLAGAGIADKRWTAKRKKEILDSRVRSGELIVKALQEIPNKIRTVVGASAIGWYGPDPSIPNLRPFTEDDPAFDDFLGQTCRQWENSLQPVTALGKRLVHLRTGIVLSKDGGALPEFENPLKFGLATILSSGNQRISWIHIDDLVRLYITSIENSQLSGVYNAVAPNPITNKDLVLQLARIKRRNLFVPVYVPSFILKMVLGEMSVEVLKSTTVSSAKIHLAGFRFDFDVLEDALKDIYK